MTSALLSPTPLIALSFAPVRGMPAQMAEKFPVRHIQDRDVWEVDCRPYGRIRSVLFPGSTTPMKLVSKAMALEVRKIILKDLERGLPEATAVSPYLPREALVENWLDRWLEHLEGQVRRKERSPTYLRRLRMFCGPKGTLAPLYGTSIHVLQLGQLEDFSIRLKDEGLSPTTVWHALSTLRTCLRWVARRSGGTYRCPDFPELERAGYEPPVLTPEQQDAVLSAIPLAKRGAYLAMADLMIRPGEARALWVEDYDWTSRELRVAHAIQGHKKDSPRGPTKGRDRRQLAVTQRLADWIEAHTSAEARLRGVVPLFPNPDAVGDPRWGEGALTRAWGAAAAKLELPTGLYVGTKHSTATWLRQSGLSLDELGLAMGHTWASRGQAVTEGYARPPRLANETIVRLLDGRGR